MQPGKADLMLYRLQLQFVPEAIACRIGFGLKIIFEPLGISRDKPLK
jgi:hypothetical protein